MKKLIKDLLGILLLLILFTSCNTIEVPPYARCTVYSDGILCLKEAEGTMTEWFINFDHAFGYQCTTPEDAQMLANEWDELAKEVLIYRAKYGELD